MKNSCFFLIFLISMSSCSVIRPVELPNIETHRFVTNSEFSSVCVYHRKQTLLVAQMGSSSAFDSKRMAYQTQLNQINYFALHQWSDTPLAQWMQLWIEHQIQTQHFKNTIMAPSVVQADYLLQFYLLESIQDFTIYPAQARFKLMAALSQARTKKLIGTKIFLGQASLSKNNPEAGVVATQMAVENVLRQVDCWLKQNT